METRGSKKKREMERSPFSELSDDLLVEIISRVPFKSTRCCKSVCRRWRDVVSHPDHRNKLPWSTLAGFFYRTGKLCCLVMNRHYQSLTGNWCPGIDPSLSFLPKYKLGEIQIDMLDCCNGLLLCRRQESNYHRKLDYVVCNPATKRWVVVPGTSSKLREARLAFDPVVSSHFHVFEFAHADAMNMRGVDTDIKLLGIYSSKSGVWTHKGDWDCPINIYNLSGCAFFRGVLYLSSYKVLAAVDVEGNCRVIPIPRSHSCFVRGVYVSQGQLYLATYSASELSIWVLEDSNTENWTLKHSVSQLQLFGAEDSYYEREYEVIIHPEYSVIFILLTSFHNHYKSGTELMSYEMDSGELHFIGDLGYDCKSPYLSYVPLFSHSLADGQ
ncbi:unnamed protein product [Alopecurus aequalis]